MTSGGKNFNYFAVNKLTKFSAVGAAFFYGLLPEHLQWAAIAAIAAPAVTAYDVNNVLTALATEDCV